MRWCVVLLRLLAMVLVIAAPASAYAVSATLSFRGAEITPFRFDDAGFAADGTANPVELSNVGDGSGLFGNCSVNATGLSLTGPCFLILPGSQVVFLIDANGVGQLVLHDFFAVNIGPVPATLVIDYQHFNGGTNPSRVQCTGMSVDGFFLTGDFTAATGASVLMTMKVLYTQPNADETTTIIVNDVTGVIEGLSTAKNCSVAGLSGSSPLVYTVPAETTDPSLNFYNPQNPKQAITQIDPCPLCNQGATIMKHYETTLDPNQANSTVGSALGALCEVVHVGEGSPTPADFAHCTAAIGALFASKEARFDFKGVFEPRDQENNLKLFGILFGSEHFDVKNVNRNKKSNLPQCVLRVNGGTKDAPAVHADFGNFNKEDRFQDLRMRFEQRALGLLPGDRVRVGDGVTVVCQVTINGTPETLTAGDVVQPGEVKP